MNDSAVAARIARTVRADIRALTAYPVAQAAGCIKLDAMECPYPLPDTVRDAIAATAREVELNRYPASDQQALKAEVAAAFGVPAGAGLLFGNGSDELIHLLIQACCEPGDTVLSPWPSFVYFDMAARFDHARFEAVPLTSDLELDLPAMLAAIERTQPKVVFLAVPNNPTGGTWTEPQIRAILAAAPGLVVIDEAYQPFADGTWMPELLAQPNLVVMRTVSKIGLAGLRFGYLAGHPAWIAEIDKVRPPYNLDVLSQAVLRTVLRHKDVLDAQAARLRADRAPLARALAALPGVQVYPSGGNFILARFSGQPDGNAVHLALKTRKILVRNFSAAHPLLAGCLRISVGTPDENAALLAALQDILSSES
ncbi:histidinol-phosphate transaminase [Bordetella genomosp. 5]|uniref:histidinol-phosphate transaminase n=1 Tax=Bordetella genomosp. 5 TaxID=1395608 RepID=UPI000B9E2968|nr:histidinol-phosphate transaminase [Bordetella genomosp. 5]OZI47223.1 histidinol-phosphate transaminase [Bordetella genomosp. 5]